MVVIRIKENDDNQIAKKICNDDIKITKNLKLCKLINSDLDEKIEKKIEFLINDKTKSNIEYNNSDDEYTIFGLQHGFDNYNRWDNSRKPFRDNRSFPEQTDTRNFHRKKSGRYRFSDWKGNDRENCKNPYRTNK